MRHLNTEMRIARDACFEARAAFVATGRAEYRKNAWGWACVAARVARDHADRLHRACNLAPTWERSRPFAHAEAAAERFARISDRIACAHAI